MTELKVGAHVPPTDPLAEAEARKADIVQIFVSNPQSWKKPLPRPDAETLRDSQIDFYVHAPYLINLASPNNRVYYATWRLFSPILAIPGSGWSGWGCSGY